MSINFAALVPHPPLAIKNKEVVNSTINSYKKLNEQIYQTKIETLIVFSPHGQNLDNAFSINQSAELNYDFSTFGDLTNYPTMSNDIELAYQIRESVETKMPLTLYNATKLDYGTGIPLLYLLNNLSNVKIIPINNSQLNYEKHIQFGEYIKEICFKSPKRIGFIASGDLAHKLSDDDQAQASGKEFDNLIIESLKNNNINQLINIKSEIIANTTTCSFRPLLILLGIIKNMNFKTEILSYESPVGIGYLTAQFLLV